MFILTCKQYNRQTINTSVFFDMKVGNQRENRIN